MSDLIDRQAAIDALNKYRIEKMVEGKDVSLVWECIDKVLQEPSAHPDGRYINADELIKRLKEAGHEEAAAMALKMAGHERKKNLPSAQPEQRWIPCSERLPEDGVYLVYAPDYSGGSSCAKEHHDGVMFSKCKKGKWSIEQGYYRRPGCVKAWMPLPEPWRGGEDE